MTKTVLNGTYSSTQYLNNGAYAFLYGNIIIAANGGDGVFSAPGNGAYFCNHGIIEAGSNGDTGNAGIGIDLGELSTVRNFNTVEGGNAGQNNAALGFQGGAGIDLVAGGQIYNDNDTIGGGKGGVSTAGDGGAGGAGIVFSGVSPTATFGQPQYVKSIGLIAGGTGGQGSAGGGQGGTGLYVSGDCHVVNTYYAYKDNLHGIIVGGAAGAGGGATGGAGVILVGRYATLGNYGLIFGGGTNPASQLGDGLDSGGTGVLAVGGRVINGSTITGGGGSATPGGYGGAGGAGVMLAAGGYLVNGGDITGGGGGYCGNPNNFGTGGAGGVGVRLDGGSTGADGISSDPSITGGAGGYGSYSGGQGGAGVIIDGNSTFSGFGFITGGRGGASAIYGGFGGVGVYLNGGTLITNATITGGMGGLGRYVPAMADAVQFGAAASTLRVYQGAAFNGNVVADQSAADMFQFAGTGGSLSGLGTQITGFSTIQVMDGASWTLTGANATYQDEVVQIDGTLAVAGMLSDMSQTDLIAGATLQATGSGDIQADAISLAGGTLACGTQASLEIIESAPPGAVAVGAITIDSGADLAGYGTIAGAVVDEGGLLAASGTISIQGMVSGSGTLSAEAGAAIDLLDGGVLGSVNGAGTLNLAGAGPYNVTKTSLLSVASLDIDPNVTLSGAGKISGAISNLGTVVASGGKLVLSHALSNCGMMVADAGATLDLATALPTTGAISGSGTLQIGSASKLGAGLSLSVTNILENANLTLQRSINFTNAPGQIFDLDPGAGRTITLAGVTGDKFTNAGTLTETGLGSADVNIALINNATILATSGTLSFLGSVSNNGTISATGGVLSFAEQVTGRGTLGLGQGGTIMLVDGTGAGQSVQFQGITGVLDLATPSAFGGLIDDFGASNQIDLLNTAATGFTFSGGVMTVQDNGATVATLNFVGPYHQSDFALGSDGHGGTVVTFT